MKNRIRLLLWPLGLLYGLFTGIRNRLYDLGILSVYTIPGKSIVIGNLSVGGTGKSPLTAYLASILLTHHHRVSTLSRGYGRTTKGLLVVKSDSLSESIGDEPLNYKTKFGDNLHVVVSEDRKKGVQFIQETFPENEVILLDDAFQHRKVAAGLSIVVTDFSTPYYADYLLPAGNLRESRSGIKRADLVIVSKCPLDLPLEDRTAITNKISLPKERIFFSSIKYLEPVKMNDFETNISEHVLVVTGIANPKPLLAYLALSYRVEAVDFRDHHRFTSSDITRVHKIFRTFDGSCKAIFTTEKDYMRLKEMGEIQSDGIPWFYIPISVEINDKERFDKLILDYVRKD